ncbi:transcriptional regulator Myc-A-like [Dendronephthya gigantea]|uniref:transcriptional regulator Myc-A-like n=1 Tax=Dendronephthya gigantea TaxID=151771 RepID=UPI00106A82D5|nr:transcriptional regulator Myc-A-like [Dendronephthya gigantea]
MLIRDCMWNGESPKKGRIFEKLRPLAKTPPLIDCNLRMYVDPSEIWPFYFNDQLKAGKTATLDNNNDNTDEEVEVDVVGLEGNPKMDAVKKEGKEIKSEKSEKCDRAESRIVEEAESTPQCENTDHDYSCKLRSGVKRRRSSCSESDKENCSEQKTRVLSGDESDPECEILGRATHNVLERKRRNELKLRFQYLRDSIPDICGNDRAPKVSILQKAYSYILQLQAEERSLVQQIKTQKNRKDQLLRKVLEMQNRNLSF